MMLHTQPQPQETIISKVNGQETYEVERSDIRI